MPTYLSLRHEPRIKQIRKEQDIINLLENVRGDITRLSNTNPELDLSYASSLKEVLKVVEKGVYHSKIDLGNRTLETEFDLSQARELVQDYRHMSEGGCQSCKSYATESMHNEVFFYCGKHEAKKDLGDGINRCSPRINKYIDKGCEDKQIIFKPLEEVLKDL